MAHLGFPKELSEEQVQFLDKVLREEYFPINEPERTSLTHALVRKEYNVGQQCLFNDLRKKVLELNK